MGDINNWYNSKLEIYGENDFRSLNWGDKEGKSAKFRYTQMFSFFNWDNSKVLEIGCGWGSFFDFKFKCSEYYGVDINPKLIEIANKKYGELSNIKFTTQNILDTPTQHFNFKQYDVALSSGVAGNRQGPADSPDKLKHYLEFMFHSAKISMINFPSNRASIRSKNVEYFSPEYILSTSLNITNNIQLVHKNQFDFLLILSHE